MSFDIDWDKIRNDGNINQSIQDFLNDKLTSAELPKYIKNLKVLNFDIGDEPPAIELKQISDPLPAFYESSEEESDEDLEYGTEEVTSKTDEREAADVATANSEKKAENKDKMDTQLVVDIAYKGNMLLEISAEISLNYPTDSFVSLPVKLSISGIGFHSLCIVAYLKSKQESKNSVDDACAENRMFFSLLCDVADSELDNPKSAQSQDSQSPNLSIQQTGATPISKTNNYRQQQYYFPSSMERMQFLRTLTVRTEIGGDDGSSSSNASALKNVGELETFLLEMLRGLIRKELCWPGWIQFEL
ncbi:hypothetical protein ACO0QE_003636 [Hanseniaspora vineae]